MLGAFRYKVDVDIRFIIYACSDFVSMFVAFKLSGTTFFICYASIQNCIRIELYILKRLQQGVDKFVLTTLPYTFEPVFQR